MNLLKNIPIRRKLMVIVALVVLLALLIAGLIQIIFQWHTLRSALLHELESHAAIIRDNSAAALQFNDKQAADETLASLASVKGIRFAGVLHNDGSIFTNYIRPGVQLKPQSVALEEGHIFSKSHIDLFRNIVVAGKKVGAIHLQADLKSLYRQLQWYVGTLILSILGSLAVAYLLFSRLHHAITGPLLNLAESMSVVSLKKDYSVRVPVSGKDEVGAAAEVFNTMLGVIESRDNELVEHRQHLQDMVEQRTLQLDEERRSAQNYLDVAGIMLVALNIQGEITLLNKKACQILGYEESELLGRDWFDNCVCEGLRDEERTVSQLLMCGESRVFEHYESTVIAKSGEEYLIKWENVILRDELGQIIGTLSSGEDITQRKQAEQALQDSEERFRSITGTAPDAVLLLDEQGKLIYWNMAAERIFGYSEAEVLGRTAHLLLLPERYHEVYKKGYSEFISTGTIKRIGKSLELEAICKDGNTIPIELSYSTVKIGDEWHAVGILRDISERKEHEDKLHRTSRALSAIHTSNILLTRSEDEQQLLQGVCQNIIEQAGYRFTWVGLQAADGDVVCPAGWAGEEQGYLDALERCRRIDSRTPCPAVIVIRTNVPYIQMDINGAPDSSLWHKEAIERSYGSVIVLPLMQGTNAFGALEIYSKEMNDFQSEEVELLKELADDLAYGITALRTNQKRQKAEEMIAYQAFHDGLTDLPNRTMVMQSLDQAIARADQMKGEIAVLFVDLDEFKLVNDTLGHIAGDELLRQASLRLKNAVRSTDIVARQGGDEFIVLLAGDSRTNVERECESEAAIVAQRILDNLKEPFQILGQEAYVSASIGVSIFPEDADNTMQMIQHADGAMYRAKELGRGNYQFYSRELSERQQKKMSMATMLHKAIEQQEFVLHYQPLIDLSDGKMVGVEALIRWERDKGNLISPADFLPVAEDTGLILPIGEWVIKEACRQAQEWVSKGVLLQVAINLSTRQMWHGNIASKALHIINETGVSKELLEFEVTESAMVMDPERMEKTLDQFKKNNIKISLDDFGTGYSSLDRLKHFPFNKLKIDKSFIDGIPDDEDDIAIVSATVQMAQSLGLSSLAEGLETVEQCRFLKTLGCDFGQGYYFSRPVPATKIEQMFKQNICWEI